MIGVWAVNWLYRKVAEGVVWLVKVLAYVNVLLCYYVSSVVVNSYIKLLCGKSYILFITFGAGDEVDKVA